MRCKGSIVRSNVLQPVPEELMMPALVLSNLQSSLRLESLVATVLLLPGMLQIGVLKPCLTVTKSSKNSRGRL